LAGLWHLFSPENATPASYVAVVPFAEQSQQPFGERFLNPHFSGIPWMACYFGVRKPEFDSWWACGAGWRGIRAGERWGVDPKSLAGVGKRIDESIALIWSVA